MLDTGLVPQDRAVAHQTHSAVCVLCSGQLCFVLIQSRHPLAPRAGCASPWITLKPQDCKRKPDLFLPLEKHQPERDATVEEGREFRQARFLGPAFRKISNVLGA
jgi:hypothetical protein